MGNAEGLRARKQRETRDAIHRAALNLALEHGPDGATTAAISARADVSARTFFNYFPSKEDAIVGVHDGLPDDDDLERFRLADSGDLLHDLVQLLLCVFRPDSELVSQRRVVVTEHPQLLQRYWARLVSIEQRIAHVTAERMRASGDFDQLPDIEAAAQTLVVTCNAALRLSIRTAVDQGTDLAHVEAGVESTIHTLREVLRTLP